MKLILRVDRFDGRSFPGMEKVFEGHGGSVGRGRNNYWSLYDPTRQLSQKHAFILNKGEQFFVVDTSSNGVFVNQTKDAIGWGRTHALTSGDVLYLGPYQLSVTVHDTCDQEPPLDHAQEVSTQHDPDTIRLPRTVVRNKAAPIEAAADTIASSNIASSTQDIAKTYHLTPKEAAELHREMARAKHNRENDQISAPDEQPSDSAHANDVDAQPLGSNVVVVEDEEDVRYLVKFMLERNDIKVTTLEDGLKAKKLIDSEGPAALVLLDVMLPHIDGFQLVEQIRGNEVWQSVPVVMLSSLSDEQTIVRALKAGANDYVVKPFKPAELLARVKRFMLAG